MNPKRDTRDRIYLYASNIAINEGKQQPVHFIPGEDLHLTDADGKELMVRIVEIVGRAALVEYRPYSQRRWKMTVKELAELLGKYPDDLRVVVNGYEDGYDGLSAERISVIKIQLDTQIHDWEDQHSDFCGSEKEISDDAEILEALVFRRRS